MKGRASFALLLSLIGPTTGVSAAPAPPAAATGAVDAGATGGDRPAVVEMRVIGHTVRGRSIRVWRVGNPEARTTAVALSTMHGDERATRQILAAIRDGDPVRGVDLWVLPVLNRDGFVANRRKNAHGVDLNRNFPRAWTDLDGAVESGPEPASEPETRALMRFLRRVEPRFVVSFHQPLYGVDVHGPKKRWFARTLADQLRLPRKEFSCGGGCHGTLSQWFNHRFEGVAVTVEYGRSPVWDRMNVQAPRQLLRALRNPRG